MISLQEVINLTNEISKQLRSRLDIELISKGFKRIHIPEGDGNFTVKYQETLIRVRPIDFENMHKAEFEQEVDTLVVYFLNQLQKTRENHTSYHSRKWVDAIPAQHDNGEWGIVCYCLGIWREENVSTIGNQTEGNQKQTN